MKNKANEHLRSSKGNNDECYTKDYGVMPLLEFLPPFKDKIIWCPFDTEDSEFVKILTKNGYNVVFSHIWNGQNFYTYEPEEWDLIVSNPPFTNKADTFKRACSFGKPFALLCPVTWLNDAAPCQIFKEYRLELLLFEGRMTFNNQPQNKDISFKSVYFCHDFLPNQIEIRGFDYGQQKLFN